MSRRSCSLLFFFSLVLLFECLFLSAFERRADVPRRQREGWRRVEERGGGEDESVEEEVFLEYLFSSGVVFSNS